MQILPKGKVIGIKINGETIPVVTYYSETTMVSIGEEEFIFFVASNSYGGDPIYYYKRENVNKIKNVTIEIYYE